MKSLYKSIASFLLCISTSLWAADPGELPLPDVPAEMNVPAERAEYILAHFWDSMEFSDTVRSLDREFMSKNIANYLSVFPHASDSAQMVAVQSFVSRAAELQPVAQLVGEILENNLMPRESPMHDDDLYAIFLAEMIERGYPNDVRNRWLLEMITKNRPGSKVPEFNIELRDGRIMSFSDIAGGKPVILVFYDPECSDCSKAINELNDDFLLRMRIENGSVKVVAIYADGDKDLWIGSNKIPDTWIDGFDTGGIMENDLFMLPGMPTIYFIMPDQTIGLKDCDIQSALRAAYRYR